MAGTQAANPNENKIVVMHMTDLHKTKNDDADADDLEDDDDNEDIDPVLTSIGIEHEGSVNRIRSLHSKSQIVATWSDTGKVFIWDIKDPLNNLITNNTSKSTLKLKPIYTVNTHHTEGYGLDWSPINQGNLLSGDCGHSLYHTMPTSNGSSFTTDILSYNIHTGSIEDIQWSPTEGNVFATCSTDGCIGIGDLREHNKAMLSVKAHEKDVNVISWNKVNSQFLLSGSDDGSFKIWDLQHFDKPVANYKWYDCPVTSVEWSPIESTVLSVSGEDGQLTVWDLSLEKDTSVGTKNDLDVPDQLLFVHRGQNHIKELHFHSQLPDVLFSTAEDGFNVFKPNTKLEDNDDLDLEMEDS